MAMALSPADNSKPLSVSYMTVGQPSEEHGDPGVGRC